MFEIIKSIINSRMYELRDILEKNDEMYLKSKLTKEEQETLYAEARKNAKAENSYASLQEQIYGIYKELDKIKEEIQELKEETGEAEQPVETNEYPEYIQPTGAYNAYNKGDKITYNGKKYVCKMSGCVWSPDVYPQAWEEVVESEGE